jgi:hypothetical protein
MVSRQADDIQSAQTVDTFIWLRSVADHITQTPNLLEAACVIQDSIKRGEIGMNV